MTMLVSDNHYNTWAMLVKYKMLVDQINDLKTKAWLELPSSEDVSIALEEAELELDRLKAWIDLNFDAQKLD